MELLNSKVDHAGYQCDHTAWGVAVCKKVGRPRVKLLYDIYHMQIMEGDVIRTIRENIQWIGHFHTAGNPGRNDMDDTQELNYAGICRAIAASGYDLYVAPRVHAPRRSHRALRTAFEICDQEERRNRRCSAHARLCQAAESVYRPSLKFPQLHIAVADDGLSAAAKRAKPDQVGRNVRRDLHG